MSKLFGMCNHFDVFSFFSHQASNIILSLFYSIAESLCDMMESVLFSMTFTCMVIIVFNLYVIELNDTLTFEIYCAFGNLAAGLALAFTYFFMSEWITSDLMQIGDHFYNSAWYQLPTKQQTLLVLPIQRAQRELRLSGLGLFDCSLEVFGQV